MIDITRKYVIEISVRLPSDANLGYRQARLAIIDNWPEGLWLTEERGITRCRIRYTFADTARPGSLSKEAFVEKHDLAERN